MVVLFALLFGEVEESLIRDRFHKAITENIQRDAEGANLLGVRDAFLDFRAGKGAIRADGAVVHEGTPLDDLGAAGDGNFGIHKLAAGAAVTDAQLVDLAGTPGDGILVALAAGLRVVERPKALGDAVRFLELCLIRRVRGVIHQTVGLIVEARGRFRKR